jgi:class 3 adenylate cyclase
MKSQKLFSPKLIFQPQFLVALTLVLFVYALYGANIVRWRNSPDFGWRTQYDSGPNVVAQVFGSAERAGLRVGDTIKAINGKAYSTFDELYFKIRNDEPGSVNIYTVERDGKTFEFHIPTSRLGLLAVLKLSIPIFAIGLIYVIIGVLVFIMKPQASESWLFLVMTFFMGMDISLGSPSDLMRPLWFYDIRRLSDVIIPAPLIHLALRFPKPRSFLVKKPWLSVVPYVLSLILLILYKTTSTAYWNPPPILELINNIYLMSGIMIFLVSMVWNIFKETSIIRLQSQVILLGIILGFFIPTVELLSRNLWGICLFPDPVLGYSFFLSIFPLSIGYTIVKHNLFDVDVYIKRAVGYSIMTVLVGTAYFSMQIGMETAFQPLFGDYSKKVFPILFAILIVFLFNPINRRVQKGVDKLFYRKKFDYKETVISISHALTSVLNLDEIIKRIIRTIRDVMFIDMAGVILLEPQKNSCQTVFIGDGAVNLKEQVKDLCIPYDCPLLNLISKEKKLITRYDIEKDPRYIDLKEPCSKRFSEMGASMVMPLIYQDEVRGALALGYKKSGHFYTREDIDLINTLADNGAVAIENTKLVDQIKKEEIIRTNLSRYLSPQIVEDIIKKDVRVNLGGDRRVVTVLFMDMIGFTSLSERLQPEEVVSILNEYFTEMSEAIFRWEGTLDKFAGDQIMAFWGAPTDQPAHAELAVRCAIDLSKKLDELRKRWEREGKPVFDSGIGINTGEALVGNIGVEGKKMDYTVIGDSVNLASRVEKLTRQYKTRILFTEYTLAHIEDCLKSNRLGPIKLTDLAEVKVKGKEKGVRIYKVESVGEI